MRSLQGLLFPIADALQMTLRYSGRTCTVKGHRRMKVALPNGVSLPIDVEIKSSFIYPAGEQAAILCKLGESLHILIAYAGVNDTVSLYVLDSRNYLGGQKALAKMVRNPRNLKEMLEHLKPGIAGSYIKRPREQWTLLQLELHEAQV